LTSVHQMMLELEESVLVRLPPKLGWLGGF
jgi:hypothetical protein